MKFLIQKVSSAEVSVEKNIVGKIQDGLCVFVGYKNDDTNEDINYLVKKLVNMRIFPDKNKTKYFEKSILETNYKILLISQFTLYADNKKGRRPSFLSAAKSEIAKKLYKTTIDIINSYNITVETGKFQAMMEIKLTNIGPTTIIIDSDERN
ncbi:MAG: D-tyrosyl-tRNA(Tyr) deacylase [Chloroflexi bacterium]|nr:D-tyrosyl-tRNA(Tyr) deacylase [Chloroflexota bacterium]MBL01777.1 D-tyrosyl-tRNA(Tyr) deacylase [Chloroflexota bacterium]|tara:strand:- start:5734 stop:6189 length:456 start_codon:yes stop_codon:yes gene_type:complete